MAAMKVNAMRGRRGEREPSLGSGPQRTFSSPGRGGHFSLLPQLVQTNPRCEKYFTSATGRCDDNQFSCENFNCHKLLLQNVVEKHSLAYF